jgi:predicted nucleotidyltransferase
MKLEKAILEEIKRRVHLNEPDTKVILYGSYAKGDANEESDIDLLILVDKNQMNYEDKIRITDPLYNLEVETGQIISPLVKTKSEWAEKYYYTPLYYNIQKEGLEI